MNDVRLRSRRCLDSATCGGGELLRVGFGIESPDGSTFSARVPAGRGAADFTPRIQPHHALALGPKICRIAWQK